MARTSILTMSVLSHIATEFVLGFALREQLMILGYRDNNQNQGAWLSILCWSQSEQRQQFGCGGS